MSSRVKGARKLQRVLKRLEPEIRDEVWEAIEEGADELLEEQHREVPKLSGNLRDALQRTRQRKSLTAKVGLVTKAARKKAPYGHIVVRGTATRAPNDFIRRAQFNKAKEILNRNEKAWRKALNKVARL